jgi:hypothetical protein
MVDVCIGFHTKIWDFKISVKIYFNLDVDSVFPWFPHKILGLMLFDCYVGCFGFPAGVYW